MTTPITKEQLIEHAQAESAALKAMIESGMYSSEVTEFYGRKIELNNIALAAMDAEPVADVVVWYKEGEERTCDIRLRRFDVAPGPLFAVAQPVTVDNTFIPKNLDRALGVVGVALPESKEEFNFQIERWIQRLIDRVIRYADEFKEKPAPVVPDEMEPTVEAIKRVLPTSNPDEYAACIGADMWNTCRAAMLQAGNSPVIPSDSEDTKRLDWLDSQNKRLNEYYGTLYGWKFDANFQRNAMMLNDSNYPVMTVRQAIDQAIAAAPQQEGK